ncbi:hypothetical protein GYMLUDRAFT_689344 [Collybiopsis luxurians FD-317 M1]|uniref:Uncharacterized protein n=1 Tax=Collybiopsis luxurians FD-317 M1 TaxID=944289 RepID=A0A0D0B5R7_9AGAR|nr:hypothetical protein GYMLUDRAFT_689344 [Collybiopsis luxurians FD-317 M1]
MRAVSFGSNSPVNKVLLLLIESGGISCAVQLLSIIFQIILTFYINFGLAETSSVVAAFFSVATSVQASYPAAVIILVSTNNSPVVETIHYLESIRDNPNAHSNTSMSS